MATAVWVLERLREAGFQALLAGGCVRDMLLGEPSADYDVATDATPQDVRKLFRRVLLVGAKFGVAMVMRGKCKVEVTTFRSEADYSDHRRPDSVEYSSPQADALRRDFTINGMFYDPLADKVIDYVGGREDLQHRVVRTIGCPDERFGEDYLRMLRAVRFAVRLGFRIDDATREAIRRHAPKITSISGERVHEELCKMFDRDSAAGALALMGELRLAEAIVPQLFAPPQRWSAGLERVDALAGERDATLIFAAWMLDMPARSIRRICRRWGASNDFRDALCFLAERRDGWRDAAEAPLCGFKRLMASEEFHRLLKIWRVEEQRRTGADEQARRIEARAAGIPPEQVNPPPLLTGDDLKSMGLAQGRRLGKILAAVRDAQLNEEVETPKQAQALARRLIDRAAQAGGGSP